jgi:L,D-transpeptidase catalytic domain/Putative peptidoglycan binding domain
MIRRLALSILVVASLAPVLRGDAAPPVLVPAGVTVAGVPVGGMSDEQAQAALRPAFAAPVRLVYGDTAWKLHLSRFGGEVAIAEGVEEALQADPGTSVELTPEVDQEAVKEFVRALAKRVAVPARDAELIGLRGLVPRYRGEDAGVRVLRGLAAQRITRALQVPSVRAIRVPVTTVEPERTLANFGPVVVIRRGANELRVYERTRMIRRFGVATGQSVYPTPTGTFAIVDKQLHPWWLPPDSEWARGLQPVPPGPGNPLGTRWMGLSAPGVGIHGTPDDASIGYSASHGCIRMHIPDAEWVFQRVKLGTPVVITDA